MNFDNGLPCIVKKKHGPRDQDRQKRDRKPKFLSWLRWKGHVFNIATQAIFKTIVACPVLRFKPFSHEYVRNVGRKCYGQLQTRLL